jgi:hypothetical protein
MAQSLHPSAPHHLPPFITAPGETDVLMWVTGVFLALFVLAVGILYFRLHALPERFAHHKVQFEVVCVLALIAMFTHMHIFWIAGLLLALIEFPDISGWLGRTARAVEKIAKGGGRPAEEPVEIVSGSGTGKPQRSVSSIGRSDGAYSLPSESMEKRETPTSA